MSVTKRLKHDAGFSLVEMMVAILCGVIVTGALFAILEVALRQTARVTDVVQATQLGRSAMTNIVDELHSACINREFAPVLEKSKSNELRFVAGFSENAVIESSQAFQHRISWAGTYPNSEKLIDKVFKAKGTSTWPKFEFEERTVFQEILLAQYVYQQSSSVPIFQYFKYDTKATNGGTETPTSTLVQVTPPPLEGFTAAEAKSIAAVQVNFNAAPSNNNTTLGRPVAFNTLVTFAFASPASEATITDGPCQ
jgi:Tfp pilus assembly protein PilW